MLLLNPGPVTLSQRVRRSLLQPDLCHRESEFFDLQDEARLRIGGVYGLDSEEWASVLLTGSGTAAVESMIAGLVPAGGKLLIVQNGVYGERIAQIAAQYQIPHTLVNHAWMDAPDITRIEAALHSDKGITHLAVIHHETTTGRLNDLSTIDKLCQAHGVRLLVDAVSSFGAEAIDFSGSIDAVAATANKCLHGVPGIAFVIARRTALASATSRTYYLDIVRHAKLQDQRNTPFTPAVHALYALVEALREHSDEGGWSARHCRYDTLASQVSGGLTALGVRELLPPSMCSVVLRAYTLPTGLEYVRLHHALKERGFVIYAGQGDLSRTLFRISTMGALDTKDADRLIAAFESILLK